MPQMDTASDGAEPLLDILDEIARCMSLGSISRAPYNRLMKWPEATEATPVFVRARLYYEPVDRQFANDWKRAHRRESSAPEPAILYHIALAKYTDFPSTLNLVDVLELAVPSLEELIRSYAKSSQDYLHGQLIFDKFIAQLKASASAPQVASAYEARLSVPHRQLDDTFQSFSAFVSANLPAQYNTIMRNASRQKLMTERRLRHYEMHELNVQEDPGNPQVWAAYMELLFRHTKITAPGQVPAFLFVFLRSLLPASERSLEWLPLWSMAADMALFTPSLENSIRDSFLRTFHKCYPSLPTPYSKLVLATQNSADLHRLLNDILGDKIIDGPKAPCCKLAINMLTKMTKFPENDPEDLEDFAQDCCDKFYCEGFDDSFELMDFVMEYFRSTELAGNILVNYVANYPHSSKAMIYAVTTLEAHSQIKQAKIISSLWDSEILEYDDPHALFARMSSFERLHCDEGEEAEVLSKLAQVQWKLAPAGAQKSFSGGTKRKSDEGEERATKVQKTKAETEAYHRDRENNRIKISPLAEGVTEKAISDFFLGYASPVTVSLHSDFAVVELATEQDVLACLTRDRKPLAGQEVAVQRLVKNSLWLTNYPLHFGVREIADMIVENTNVKPLDVRVPSQNDNRERRFCYVDFADDKQALEAKVALDGLQLGELTLKAAISDPLSKHSLPKSHQVYVHNLNFNTTAAEIQESLSCFGEVGFVKVPANKTKTTVNGGFAFVTFSTKESAHAALKAKEIDIGGRTVKISPIKSKAEQHTQAHFDEKHTITLKNIESTVSADQLKVFLQPIGEVRSVQTKPSRGLALVEFEDEKTAGEAGIKLEGKEFNGKVLTVCPRADFFQETQTTTVPSMVPPMLMRRRRPKK